MSYSDDDSYELYRDYEKYEEYCRQYEEENIKEVASTSISHQTKFDRIEDGYSYSHMYETDIRPYSSRSKMEKVRLKEPLQYLFEYLRLSKGFREILSFKEYYELHITDLFKDP